MKAIIFARVSTLEQREAGNSIPAQITRLQSYCDRKGFQVVETYSFDESAYKTKRDEFDKFLDLIGKMKEKVAVCFDKVDRLSRNIFDPRIAWLYEKSTSGTIELHFVSDNQVINDNLSAGEKTHFGINLVMAKAYSDAISDNVKRAYEKMRANGQWTGKAPIGYLNQKVDERKSVVPDPKTAHFVRKIFEMYASGNASVKMIRNEIAELGLTSSVGKPLSVSMIAHILNNPFYYGEMRSKGVLYPHKYEPLISKHLYNQCQMVLKGWHTKRTQYAAKPYIFRGLLPCANCGCLMSPETAKGKFIYYSCTNAKGICKRVYVPEKVLLKPIQEVLERFQRLSQEVIDEVVNGMKKAGGDQAEFHRKAIAGMREEYDQIQAKLDRYLDLVADGLLSKQDYEKKVVAIKDRQQEINYKLEAYTKADETFYLTAGRVLSLAKRAKDIFDSSEPDEKRAFLNYLLQNPRVDGKKLIFSLRSPFNHILEFSDCSTGLREQDSNLQPTP